MLKENADLILGRISSSDIVVDIGGWAKPFNRANYVVDIMPYETRGIFGSMGGEEEFFSKERWIVHDPSGPIPLPFKDKSVDFVICSHTLEDIRDPLFLCSELIRIGKRGYIEVPSRIEESTIGLENRRYAGYYHHRWLIEIENKELIFRFKSLLLNLSWKYHFPNRCLQRLKPQERVSCFFWENDFVYKEIAQVSGINTASELEAFVRKNKAYPEFFYILDKAKSSVKSLIRRLFTTNDPERKKQELLWLKIPDVYLK